MICEIFMQRCHHDDGKMLKFLFGRSSGKMQCSFGGQCRSAIAGVRGGYDGTGYKRSLQPPTSWSIGLAMVRPRQDS